MGRRHLGLVDAEVQRRLRRRSRSSSEKRDLDLPFIIVSGTVGEESAVDAMRAGARDYVLKDKLSRLAPAVERELLEHKNRRALPRGPKRGRREAERRSQRIVESAMVGMWMLDAEDKTTFMNARMAAILGVDVEAGGSRYRSLEFFVEEDRSALSRSDSKQRKAGIRSGAYEQKRLRRGGRIGGPICRSRRARSATRVGPSTGCSGS